jgi:23S rRNA (guanosine2251-2'-O)-methyltransferase
LVVGAESKGVSREVMQAADTCFWIPQKGTTDSFNVSVAAGIMLYETIRQRGI